MTGGASLTSESELCRGLDLPVAPGDEALVDAVVLPLEVVDLQGLLVETDPVVVGEHQPVLPPEDGGPVPLLGEALHVGGPPDVNDLLGRHQVCSTEEIKIYRGPACPVSYITHTKLGPTGLEGKKNQYR